MRLLGLTVFAVLTALACGAAQAIAAPGTSTPSTPSTPSNPSTPTTPGTAAPGAPAVPEMTGIPEVDRILDTLAGSGSLAPDTKPDETDTRQMIVVTSPKASNPTATLTAFERGADNSWKPVIGPTKAFLGSQGMGEPQDNVPRSPQGTFVLDQAFGRLANPGTKMPYFKTDRQDWWDSNMQSPTYNKHVRQPQSPGGDSENLYDAGPVYDYAVNIAHNPQRVPGKATAMFLHVSNDLPTLGCVAIDKDLMRQVLVWLDPAKKPKITIGVNEPAPSDGKPGTAPGTSTPNASPGVPPLADMLSGAQLTNLLGQLTDLIPNMLGGTGTGTGTGVGGRP